MPSQKTPVVAPESASAASSPIEDPVPAEVHAVIELFANQLANISFPDIDAAALRRQADELRSEAKKVAHAREALDAALESFVTRLAKLTETAARAVAYARIYSVAHPEQQTLAAALVGLGEPLPAAGGSTSGHGRRRSRPARRSAELFDNAAPAAQHKDPA
jgi:hypothetical protein